MCVQQHSINSAVFIFVKLQNVGASGLFELEAAAAAVMGKTSITRHWEGLAVRKESVATAVALASLEEQACLANSAVTWGCLGRLEVCKTSGVDCDLATTAWEGVALAGRSELAFWFTRPLLLYPPHRQGGILAGLPSLDPGWW